MAVHRKKLVDKDGNTIIPAVGDIYGTVYNATLSSATAGGRADYEFTPDTPVENNKVYAVKFPAPTVNNATIILGDGVVSGSILVPPVSATDSPNYELLTTDMINNTEPLLLMYSGVQWVCLNQKKKVATADLENGAITTAKIADGAVSNAKIDWTTMPVRYTSSVTGNKPTVNMTVNLPLRKSSAYTLYLSTIGGGYSPTEHVVFFRIDGTNVANVTHGKLSSTGQNITDISLSGYNATNQTVQLSVTYDGNVFWNLFVRAYNRDETY